jgi:hypothetical protein
MDFNFDVHHFGWVKRLLLLLNGNNIRQCVDMVFNNGRVKTKHFCIRIGKDALKIMKMSLICKDFGVRHITREWHKTRF